MYSEQISLKYQGFRPSEFIHTHVNDKLQTLIDEAPEGAQLQTVFTKKDDFFKGLLTVYTSAGQFFAVATGSQINQVNEKLIEQIRKQLNKWKSKKFKRKSLKSIKIDHAHIDQDIVRF